MQNEDAVAVGFRDLLMGLLSIFVLIIVVVTLWVNDPEASETKTESPGQLIVTMFWNQGPYDVDLWLNAPGESKPVGFSNKAGVTWNLLRDDLGVTTDNLPLNYENAYSRGTPEGKYTINAFCYSCDKPVSINIKLEKMAEIGVVEVASENFVLQTKGDWRTFINFEMNDKGQITSFSKVQKDLLNE